jgi:asparagine synthase (glutamine-hydrolysing)
MFTICANRTTERLTSAFKLSGDIENAKRSGALSTFRAHGYEIVCWGDPAQHTEDAGIIRAVLNGQGSPVWGRSWLAFNHYRQTLTGQTDVIGAFPIFVLQHRTGVLVANNRHDIREYFPSLDLNANAMRQLMAFGQVLDHQSIDSDVKHLPGRSALSVSDHSAVKITTDDRPLIGNWSSNFNTALEAFVEGIRTTVQQNPNVLVSLSGGLDSRLILAAVLAVGGKPTGICYGNPNSTDARIAKTIANQNGMPLFSGKNISTKNAWSTFQRVAHLGGGEVSVHHAHSIMDSALLEQTRGHTLLTGTGAEAFRAFYFDRGAPGYSLFALKQLRSKLLPKAKRYIQEEYAKTALPFFNIAPNYAEELADLLSGRIDRLADQCSSAVMLMDNFYLLNRVTRMVLSGQFLLDDHYFRSHPFLNKDALFYIGNLPVRYKLGSQFHREAIAKLSPSLAAIPWDKTGNPLNDGLPFGQRYPAIAARTGLQRWGKQSQPMFNYKGLLAQVPDAAIIHTLREIGCCDTTGQPKYTQIDSAKRSDHFLGYSAVWNCMKRPSTFAHLTASA